MTTVTLGLDGGSFELIEPWLQNNKLPNIEYIQRKGTAGDMQSCVPPVTCPNWQCYATGQNPGKLGVFWWETIDREKHNIRNTSRIENFDGEPFWRRLNHDVAVINLPTSYPPPDVNGIHISGGPGAEQTGFTSPASLESKLRDEYDYQVHPEQISLLSKDNPDSPCVDEIYRLIDQRFDVLLDELATGEYEYIHLTVFYLNMLQHFYWDDPVVEKAWQRIDDRVGELLEADELNRLLVMSDHGSNETKIEFHINTWLKQQGYLITTDSSTDWLSRLGITRERIRPFLGKLGIEWWLRQFIPDRVQDMLPSEDGRIKKSGKESVIDWDQSTAVASGQGPLYVLSDDPTEHERIRSELIEALDGLVDDQGTTVVSEALPAASVYNGPYLDEGPDIILRQAPNVHIDGSIGADSVFDDPDTWRGENKETGFFMAYGDDFVTDSFSSEMHILDIAPTILHLHGEDIPTFFDGTVRSELFAAGSDAADREPNRVTASDEIDQRAVDRTGSVSDRLEDLGYK
ncbi:nucleotide pyrophosphatase [Halobaculum sp. WSA2]|uniref:Nucleotide pyrophosphatase n=1 Tax=Halobaculum saliterrae TaxID=2073113 RepID=A0A6B0SZ50_9EURY|nr:alkaline phosphatase family protein [Halobaculum saliterrae]MXR41853.1 nucleotide pyrophosphatase [Halobaculum saliterrae]